MEAALLRALGALGLGLSLLFLLLWYAHHHRSVARLPEHGLVMTLTVAGRAAGIRGVEREDRVRSTRHALQLLHAADRGVMYREDPVWVVATGPGVTLMLQPEGPLAVHYLLRSAPRVLRRGGGASPSPPPGFVAHPHSAVAADAMVAGGIRRFDHWPDVATDRDLIMYNGPHNPAFYLIPLPEGRPISEAIVTADGLPGTVYHRPPTPKG